MKGNIDTVAFMRNRAHEAAADPAFQRFARLIVNHVDSHDYAGEAVSIGEYVQSNVRYIMDPKGIEHLQEPALLIRDINQGIAAGDCDDMALLAVSLLLAIGHDPFFRVVRYNGSFGPYNHIYVVDYIEGGRTRVVIDCIIKNQAIGYEVPHSSGQEIEV